MTHKSNVSWHQSIIKRESRELQNSHRSVIIWFTGLSGAGKSTLAHSVEERLHMLGCRTFVLDGDNIRHGLCSDLSFSDQDRVENIRRVGEVAKLFMEAGVIVLTAFISPFRADRRRVRNMLGHSDFIEVYCSAPIEVCEQRDVKGLYKKAREGKLKEFTGISSPYETPNSPEIIAQTGEETLAKCVDTVIEYLYQSKVIVRKKNADA